MSISRGNWSSLSRLAQQWMEDDEEEQQREMRRRHRDLSNPTNRVIEVEDDKPSANLVRSSHNKEEKQQNPTIKEFQRDDEETQKEYDNSNKGHKEESEGKKIPSHKTLELTSNEEKSPNPRGSGEDVQERENPNPNNRNSHRQRDNLNEKCREPVNSEGKQRTHHGINEESNKEPTRHQEKKKMVEAQDVEHEEISAHEERNIQNQNTAEHRKNSASVSHSVVQTPSDAETKDSSSASPSTGGNNTFKSQVFVSSVKILRQHSGILSPPPIPEEATDEAPAATRAVRTKVMSPPASNTTQSDKQDAASQQTSSPFRRFTPFTSSVKIVRLPETESETQASSGLRRSSSLRLSLRKIDDRVEKYTSAVKKTASVRIPSVRNESVLGGSDGIVSKRSIFEKEDSTTRPEISKKDLNLPGGVASRINQWRNKIQNSSSASSGLKDFRTGDVASKRRLWQQRSQSSSDSKP
ncbi:ladinin-1 [Dendropsophus ebraccatus]|uniref:ladinin-1 n=1 Tax=Dendropsophus ebraccatus TaxID=150705 RepID=UPI0038311702